MDNLHVLRSVTSIIFAEALLACNIMYSEVTRFRAWASLGDSCTCHNPYAVCNLLNVSVLISSFVKWAYRYLTQKGLLKLNQIIVKLSFTLLPTPFFPGATQVLI